MPVAFTEKNVDGSPFSENKSDDEEQKKAYSHKEGQQRDVPMVASK
jgi:hypothetical protein